MGSHKKCQLLKSKTFPPPVRLLFIFIDMSDDNTKRKEKRAKGKSDFSEDCVLAPNPCLQTKVKSATLLKRTVGTWKCMRE